MIGLIALCLFCGAFMSAYLQSSWTYGTLALSDNFYIAFAGLLAVVALILAGIWQARKGKPLLGLSRGGFIAAVTLPYMAGVVGGFFL